MPVRAQVHRHPGHPGGEVRAVVEVEAAEEVLVGLAGAAVLRHDHAGNIFEQVAGTQQRAIADELRGDHALARGVARADAIVVVAEHGHGGQLRDHAVARIRGERCYLGTRRHARDGEGECRDRAKATGGHGKGLLGVGSL